jgi:hypothetical protein
VEGARYEKTDISAFPDHQLYPNSHFEAGPDGAGREASASEP